MNNTVEEADLDNTHPWIQVSWTDNRFYANDIPIPVTMTQKIAPMVELTLLTQVRRPISRNMIQTRMEPQYTVTLTIMGRKGSSNVTLTHSGSQ